MQEQLDKIEAKVDKILEIQGEMKVVQAEQHGTLQEHMRRSLANEQAVTLLAKELKTVENDDIKPLTAHSVKFELILKIIMWITGLAVSAYAGHIFIHF